AQLRAEGIEDVRGYSVAHPDELARAVGSLRTTDVNAETLRMLCARSKDELCPSPECVFLPETHEAFARQLEAIADGEIDVTVETAIRTLTGERRDVVVRIRFPEEGEPFDRVPMSLVDITARKRGERALSLLAQTSVVLAESVHAGETLQRVAQLAVPAIADWEIGRAS